jgi:hypothetical protein
MVSFIPMMILTMILVMSKIQTIFLWIYNKMVPRKQKLAVSIVLFLALFSLFHFLKPGFAYNSKGGFRQFGVGYNHKTIFPVWIVAIVLAIFSYTVVLVL